MTIKELSPSELSTDLQQQVNALFRQLTETMQPLKLAQVVRQGGGTLMLCFMEGNRLLGMASMATYSVVSGQKGWIEDVVVDQAERGRGIGRILVTRLVEKGKRQGLTEILLFTGSSRLPAISLYESLGFERKDSHLYRLKIA